MFLPIFYPFCTKIRSEPRLDIVKWIGRNTDGIMNGIDNVSTYPIIKFKHILDDFSFSSPVT